MRHSAMEKPNIGLTIAWVITIPEKPSGYEVGEAVSFAD